MKNYLYGKVTVDTLYSSVRSIFNEVEQPVFDYLKTFIWPLYNGTDRAHDLNHLLNMCLVYRDIRIALSNISLVNANLCEEHRQPAINVTQTEVIMAISYHDVAKQHAGNTCHAMLGAERVNHHDGIFKALGISAESHDNVRSAVYHHMKSTAPETELCDLAKLLHDIDLYESYPANYNVVCSTFDHPVTLDRIAFRCIVGAINIFFKDHSSYNEESDLSKILEIAYVHANERYLVHPQTKDVTKTRIPLFTELYKEIQDDLWYESQRTVNIVPKMITKYPQLKLEDENYTLLQGILLAQYDRYKRDLLTTARRIRFNDMHAILREDGPAHLDYKSMYPEPNKE